MRRLLKRLTTPPPLRPRDFPRECLKRGTIFITEKIKIEDCKRKITESKALTNLFIIKYNIADR
jgi:hypothetical protein